MNVSFETGGDGATATTHDWLTPPELLQALGAFDMDPCASQYQPWRTAAQQFTIEDDGLAREWRGRVLLTIDENDTISPCHNDAHHPLQNPAQNVEWLSRLPLSISVPVPADHSDFCHVAGSAWHKTTRSENAELVNSGQENGDSTRNLECSNAQNAEPSIRQRLHISGLSQGAAMGLPHGAENAPERKQETAGQRSEPQQAASRRSNKSGSGTPNQNLGKRQSAQAHEFTMPSGGSEKQGFRLLGQIPTGWVVSPLSAAPAHTAVQQPIYTKTTSYQSRTLIVPELSSATWCQRAGHATSQKGPSIRIPGLRTKLLSLGLIESCGVFVGHYKPRIWLNPPFGREAVKWLKRMADHGNGIALIFARTETKAFQEFCWRKADAMLFMAGRIKFRLPGGGTSGTAGAPSVLIAYGKENAEALRRSGIAGYVVNLDNKEQAASLQSTLFAEAA